MIQQNLKKDDNDKRWERKKSKKRKWRRIFVLGVFKGFTGGYSFSEVGREQANDMTEDKKKKKKKTFCKFNKDLPFSWSQSSTGRVYLNGIFLFAIW